MTKKKAAGLEALKQLSNVEESSKIPEVTSSLKPKPKKGKDKVIFSLHLSSQAHEKLRELSFFERQSMTRLLLEGLDMVFEKRGIQIKKGE